MKEKNMKLEEGFSKVTYFSKILQIEIWFLPHLPGSKFHNSFVIMSVCINICVSLVSVSIRSLYQVLSDALHHRSFFHACMLMHI